MSTGDVPICRVCGKYAFPTDVGPHKCDTRGLIRWEDEPKAFYGVQELREDYRKHLYENVSQKLSTMKLADLLRIKVQDAILEEVNTAYNEIVELLKDEADTGRTSSCIHLDKFKLSSTNAMQQLANKLRDEAGLRVNEYLTGEYPSLSISW